MKGIRVVFTPSPISLSSGWRSASPIKGCAIRARASQRDPILVFSKSMSDTNIGKIGEGLIVCY